MEVIIYDKPVDRVRAYIQEYAEQLYGIKNASALSPLVEVAFNQNANEANRIRAASELAKYSEIPTRSIEYDGGKNGPDLEVIIQGACEIGVVANGPNSKDPKQLVSPVSSDSIVELSDERGEEGG